MATANNPVRPPSSHRGKPDRSETAFFVGIAVAMAALTLVAFSTTYLLPVSSGRFIGPPLLHLHGILFLAWPVLFIMQALTSARKLALHRGLGLASISLATAMVLTGLAAIGSSIASWRERGVGTEGQTISVIAFTGAAMFTVLFAAAVWKRRDRLAHSRLMTLATLSIMQASSGRLALLISSGGNLDLQRPGMLVPPPLMFVAIPHLIFDLLVIGALAWHDRRRLGSIHHATIAGGALIVLVHLGRPLLAASPAWTAIAGSLETFMSNVSLT